MTSGSLRKLSFYDANNSVILLAVQVRSLKHRLVNKLRAVKKRRPGPSCYRSTAGIAHFSMYVPGITQLASY
jgi:hypothetical protein